MKTASLTNLPFLVEKCQDILGAGSTKWGRHRLAASIKAELMRLALMKGVKRMASEVTNDSCTSSNKRHKKQEEEKVGGGGEEREKEG